MTQPTAKHYRTCNLCEAMCGLEIEHQGSKILSIKGDKNDVLSRGHICPKALAVFINRSLDFVMNDTLPNGERNVALIE